MAQSANRLELIQIADAVAREKSIEPAVVLRAMQDAMERVARFQYGMESDIRAEINPQTGETRIFRLLKVEEAVENPAREISLAAAKERNPAAEAGDFISEPLPPVEFGRVSAQSAKQIIIQSVRDAERERTYLYYRDRVGEVVNGQIRRVEYGNVFVEFDRGEAIIRRSEQIPRESFHYGDRVRAYIYDVRRETRGPQVFLSRTHPQFLACLFTQEVPEIYDGIIEIKSVARDPGSRAKIAVLSRDSSIDPVGACVGLRGSRVRAVVAELQGEKIDIIPWSDDSATFIVNALQPAELSKVVIEEDTRRVEVVVNEDQLSLAIGRRGQNVRLASQLTGWDIDILTETEESQRSQSEFEERSRIFVEQLDLDEVVAQLLASEGFRDIYELAYVDAGELVAIEGLSLESASELQTRARDCLERKENEALVALDRLSVSDELRNIEMLEPPMLVALGEAGICTLEDLAGCARDDLVANVGEGGDQPVEAGILDSFNPDHDAIDRLIMDARVAAGWIEEEKEVNVDPEQPVDLAHVEENPDPAEIPGSGIASSEVQDHQSEEIPAGS